MKQSKLFRLNKRDLFNGIIVTVIGSIGTSLVSAMDSGHLPTVAQIKAATVVGISAGISYLVKNFFSNPSTN